MFKSECNNGVYRNFQKPASIFVNLLLLVILDFLVSYKFVIGALRIVRSVVLREVVNKCMYDLYCSTVLLKQIIALIVNRSSE